MRKKLFMIGLAVTLCLGLVIPAAAASPPSDQEAAADYVRERGIMVGDQNGNMNLASSLNRAELAVLLTRLRGGVEELQANTAYYERGCKFVDVPAWAKLYVGYCVRNNLVAGYDKLHYGAADPVTPAAACTVILRASGIMDGEGSVWSYGTACSYALGLGWIDEPTAHAESITRGEMAVLIYRALTGRHPGDTPSASQNTGDGYLSNGKPVTEENVLELLRQIEKEWPHGTVWGTHNTPGTHKNEVPSTAANRIMDVYWVSEYYGCSGYASMVSSLIFGDKTNPGRRVEDLSQIRPGDILFWVRNSDNSIWHVSVALESPDEIHAFHETDGNHGGIIRWPNQESQYSKNNLDSYRGENRAYRLEAWTRYPEDVAYTGNSAGAWSSDALN